MSGKQTFVLCATPYLTAIVLGIASLPLFFNGNSQEIASPLPESSVVEKPSSGQVAAIATQAAGLAISQSSTSALEPQDASKNPFAKGEVTIALLGDSMIDTMGDLKNLELALGQYYPNVTFKLLNYGVGSTPIESGLKRLTQSFKNHDSDFPPLLLKNPDIVIVESFAYNHPPDTLEGTTAYKETLSQILRELKAHGVEAVVLSTVGPNEETFALGAPGISWSREQRKIEAQAVEAYLTIAAEVAKTTNTPFVDAYHPSLDPSGQGSQIFINPQDNIHPSQAGIELVSDLIAQKLKEISLVEKVLTP